MPGSSVTARGTCKTAGRRDKRCADPADARVGNGVLEGPLLIKRLMSQPQCERIVFGHAAPASGTHPDDAAKVLVEMRLICESAGQRNVHERLARGCHHEPGALDSS